MKVAYLHYHLNPGGVTAVIRQQVESLRNMGGEAIVLTGLLPPTPFPAETAIVPGLGYTRTDETRSEAETIAENVASAIMKRWPRGCDLIHVHNPILAKNIGFPGILKALQKKEFRLLLQVHDFSEDGRPDVYFQSPYPRNCHYAVINSRDYHILLQAGLKKEGLHLIPNMVTPLEPSISAAPDKPFILYPVRAIRRKNIGEALLAALFFHPGHVLAITLPPNSDADMAAYKDWQVFAKQYHLPVRFEAGIDNDFQNLVAASECFISTSVTEGFGFSFLEPWTAGKFLRGRKLPDICHDFEEHGLLLDHLYPHLRIPLAWINHERYLGSWRKAVGKAADRYNFRPDPMALSEVESRLAKSRVLDFGLLNEKYQKAVLRRLIAAPGEKAVLKDLNPFLETPVNASGSVNRIRHNRDKVLTHYNAASYEHRLRRAYKTVTGADVSQEIQKDILLSHFFDLDRFSLLKWGAYET